ncbi:MAG: hypothetical protein KKD08_03095 [Alphaproteobacteria bacterium]|nr:hypothetical protein [Alphaproteobacteria bacterium]
MRAFRKFWARQTAVVTFVAVMTTACAYGPVIVDDYVGASGYQELLAQIGTDRELQEAIDENVLRVTRSDGPGADWNSDGEDIEALIAASSGGKLNTVLVAQRGDELWVSSYRGFGDDFGPDYAEYPVFGPNVMFDEPKDNRSFNLLRVGEGVWLETIKTERKIEIATCSSSGSEAARLFSNRPYTSLSKLEKSTLAAYVSGARRRDVEVCTVYSSKDGSRLDRRFFLPNGQSLPVFNREAPAAELRPRSEIVGKIR